MDWKALSRGERYEFYVSLCYLGVGGVFITVLLLFTADKVHWLSWMWGVFCAICLVVGLIGRYCERVKGEGK